MTAKKSAFLIFSFPSSLSRLLSRCGWAALASSATTHNNSYCDYSPTRKSNDLKENARRNRRSQGHTEAPASIFYLIFIIQFNLDHTFSSIRKVSLIHVVFRHVVWVISISLAGITEVPCFIWLVKSSGYKTFYFWYSRSSLSIEHSDSSSASTEIKHMLEDVYLAKIMFQFFKNTCGKPTEHPFQ